MKTVIEMAKEIVGDYTKQDYWPFFVEELERFAALVAAAEREACAQILDGVDSYANPMTANDCADAIRARGQS